MRLTTIKLAGFKSFVDPTTLHLPTNMIGIVGPNGCGKSNIIDAIRWVMGESAASRLRGDSLTDVIFSGSSARKPVGAATVELIFDNSDGAAGGEYARFSEISVKRTVSRDSISTYYLNGARCRRRDILDVFLGTGLGPRSYSIIEQGMISQIVEARPEDLRMHLEEAAGISRYKERRRETESRIKSTRENLNRVRDQAQEIGRQCEHLQRQAKAAERYQRLQREHEQVSAELKLLELRALDAELVLRESELRGEELELEKSLAEQRRVEAELERFRGRQQGATDGFNAAQADVYRVGAEIARIEQQIAHRRELAERLSRSAQEIAVQIAAIASHLESDALQIDELRAALGDAEPQIETARGLVQQGRATQLAAEAAIGDWQARWDEYAKVSGEAAKLAEVERTRIDYLDRQALEISRRREALAQEKGLLDVAALNVALVDMEAAQKAGAESLAALRDDLDARRSRGDDAACRQREQLEQQASMRGEIEAAGGRLASLEALQQAALGGASGALAEALAHSGLADAQRLGLALHVEAGWERAVETVLSGWLDAVLVEDPHADRAGLDGLEHADFGLLRSGGAQAGVGGSLASKVQGPAAALSLLAEVEVAQDLSQARAIASQLDAGRSVITPGGEWLGRDWMRVLRADVAQAGMLARERELTQLRASLAALQQRAAAQAGQLAALQSEINAAETARDEAQHAQYAAQRRAAELAGQVTSQRGRLDAAVARLARIDAELSEATSQAESVTQQARDARGRLDGVIGRMGDMEGERGELDRKRRDLLESREEARAALRDVEEQLHARALAIESKRARLASLEQARERLVTQRAQLHTQSEGIDAQLAEGHAPAAQLDQERQTYLEQRLLVDRALVAARQSLEDIASETRGFEAERTRLDAASNAVRDAVAQRRVDAQGARVRAETLRESILVAGFDLEALAASLAEDADNARWHARADEVALKMRRLEPVNLAAIQEFREQSERKGYLDAQLLDLETAMAELEGAIRKLDRETRSRFKETFERVNAGLQELFPQLFGGGHAYLELTGEDLLDTGVTIMARPPGKRVSSISLLSGGEKALTAVALVFSIFRLNPAPFCLLDEVDAPLDEANVGRFSQMVREMSEHVQFIIVTHNKATMESTSQLCGVTMREPGVSRLVQVDLAEAAKLAGAA